LRRTNYWSNIYFRANSIFRRKKNRNRIKKYSRGKNLRKKSTIFRGIKGREIRLTGARTKARTRRRTRVKIRIIITIIIRKRN